MKPQALILLEDPKARRMAATWPLVKAREGWRAPAEWARLSGVPLSDVRRLAKVLFGSEICLPDGTVDPNAERYLAGLALSKVRRPGRRKTDEEGRAGGDKTIT